MVMVSGSGIAAGAADVLAVGANTSGAVAEGEGSVDVDVDEEGVAGVDVDVGGISCSGSSAPPGFAVGETLVGVNIDRNSRPTRGWYRSNRTGSSDCRHIRYSTFRFAVGSALFSA